MIVAGFSKTFKINRAGSFLLPFLFSCLLVACGGGGGGGGGSTPPPAEQPAAAIAPTIDTQPTSVAVADGDPAAFSVVAAGTPPLVYQWKKNGVDVPGANAATYRLDAATLAASGALFTATVTNAAGSVASADAELNVWPVLVAIVAQPLPQFVLDGGSATFTVAATGSEPYSFQWQRDGIDIPGAINATYTLTSVSAADSGAVFSARVTNIAGTVESGVVYLNVTTTPVPPGIATQPQSVTAASGSTPMLSVVATGTSPFSYQWRRNGIAILGANSSSYTLPPINMLNSEATYSVTIDNAAGNIDSQSVQVTATATALDLYAGAPGGSGNLDGPLLAARFSSPKIVSTDAAGNIYVVDGTGQLLRKVATSGSVTTLFPVPYARVAGPDSSGNFFVAGDCSIAKFSPSGVSSYFAGSPNINGTVCGLLVSVNNAAGIMAMQMLLGQDGNLYFTETNCTVRKVTPAGTVSTLAGQPDSCGIQDGTGAAALLGELEWIGETAAGNLVIIQKNNNAYTVRQITTAGVVTTLSSTLTGYTDSDSSFHSFVYGPDAADAQGNLYDSSVTQLVRLSPTGQTQLKVGAEFITGHVDGPANTARLEGMGNVTPDGHGGALVRNFFTLRRIDSAGVVSTLAGSAEQTGLFDPAIAGSHLYRPQGIAFDADDNLLVANTFIPWVSKVTPDGHVWSLGGSNIYSAAVAVDAAGNVLVTDTSRHSILKIDATNAVSHIAGDGFFSGSADGNGAAASFSRPAGIAVAPDGTIYVADTFNSTIRKIDTSNNVTTIAGVAHDEGSADGTSAARFNKPAGLALAANGDLYIADSGNNTIRKISGGVVSTVAGNPAQAGFADGVNALFRNPWAVAFDDTGALYVADKDNHAVRKIAGGSVSTLAGKPSAVSSEAGSAGLQLGALPGSLNEPSGLAFVVKGSKRLLMVADEAENSILSIVLP